MWQTFRVFARRNFEKSFCTRSAISEVCTIPVAERRRMPGFLRSIISMVNADQAIRLHVHVDELHKELGPIYRDRVGPLDLIFLNSPDDFRKVFRVEGRTPHNFLPEAWSLYNQIRQRPRGLLFMQGEEWLNSRRIMNNVMLLPDPADYLRKPCALAARDLVEGWKLLADTQETIPQLERRLYQWSINVVIATMMGSSWQSFKPEIEKKTEHLAGILHQIFALSAKLSLLPVKYAMKLRLPVWQQFCSVADETLTIVNSLVSDMIKTEKDGLLSLMKSEGLTNESDLVRIVSDLVIAAGDTTAYSTQWALFLLAQNSNVQEKLYERIKNLDDTEILADPYVKSIIKESLRLYPTAPFLLRFLPVDCQLAGHHVSKEQLIVMSLYSSARDSANFTNPNEFHPERWIRNEQGSCERVIKPHGSLPFGLGARSCVGRKLAETQMILTLSHMIKNFRIECPNADRVKMILHLISVPSEPIKLKLFTR